VVNAPLGRIVHVGRHIFVREFKLRYRRAVLGLLWAVLPLALAGAAIVHLGARLGVAEPDGAVPYALRVFLGIVLMQVLVDALDAPQQLARRYAGLLARVPFPGESLLVAALGFVAFNLAIRLLFVAALFVHYGIAPAATLPLALPLIATLAMTGLGLGALLAPVSLLLWDVRFGLPYLTAFLYVLTPVFYPAATDGLLGAVHQANPLTHLLAAITDLVFRGAGPVTWLASALLLVASLFLARASFAHYRRAMLRACPHV
jgi:lipopolysaccharide transport system permease protein